MKKYKIIKIYFKYLKKTVLFSSVFNSEFSIKRKTINVIILFKLNAS